MDFSKFKPSDWLKVGGGALMLIGYFLRWWEVDYLGFSSGVSGSEYFWTGTIPWLLLVAIGVLSLLAAAGIFKLPSNLPAPLIYLGASALAFLLVLIRFFSDGVDSGGVNIPTTRGIGLYMAFIASIAVVAGCVMGFKESGGDLNDLKDINKIKGQFGGGSSAPPPPPGGPTPPPPPGGMAPPPPPPGNPPPPPPR